MKFQNNQCDVPWLCAGDFNEIIDANEQFGGSGRSERQMNAFREAVSMCGLVDLGFISLLYTWDNRRDGDYYNIKVGLDSVCEQWFHEYF
jgi:hypothetical protein